DGGVGGQRSLRDRARAGASAGDAGQRIRRQGAPAAGDAAPGHGLAVGIERGARIVGTGVHRPLPPDPRLGVPAVRERGDPVGAGAVLRDHLKGCHMASVMSFPTRIVYGRGAIKELSNELKRAGATRPLLVTDKGLLQAGLLRFVTPLLEQAGVKTQVFSEFEANPTDRDALRGIEAYRAAQADSVLGVGGGASLDMAKAIALLVHHLPP